MNVKVKVSGGSTQAIVRGHMYQSTAEETLTIASASTSPRIDAVVLRLDPSVNSIVLAVVQGTPASTPSAPTLTQTDTAVYELLLGYVAVSASATTISAGDVTDKRVFLGNVWTTANRPAPKLGLTGFNTTLGKLESWTGSSWDVVTPTSLDASVITSGTIDNARLATTAINKGGTGATSASDARTALGITPQNIGAALTDHQHAASAITSGTLDSARIPNITVAMGGTGATSAAQARVNLEAAVNKSPTNQVGVGWTQSGGFRGYVDATDFGRIVFSNSSNEVTNAVNTSGYVTALGFAGGADGISTAGGVVSGNGISSPVTYNQNNSGRAMYIASNGLMGVGGSSERFKDNIVDAEIDTEKVLQIAVRNYSYKKSFSDDQSLQIGVIAEELLALGLNEFVFFDADGVPDGVAYEKLALALFPVVQNQATQLKSIEARLEALEK